MEKQLLFSVTKDDLRIDTFRAGGKGGQNQNKRDTGVRVTHIESGASGEGRDSRSQGQNKVEAFRRMVLSDKFKNWMKEEILSHSVAEVDFSEDADIVIRTYNYPRWMVTDHRTGEKYSINSFMNGER